MKLVHGRWRVSMVRVYDSTSKKISFESHGPLTRCKLNVDLEERPWSKKWRCWYFNIYIKNGNLIKKSTLTILLASIVLSWPHFLFLFVFTLNFSKHDCNRGEEEEPCFSFRIIHVFVHACEACCGHLSNTFARRVGDYCNFELGVWGIEREVYGVKNGCPDL